MEPLYSLIQSIADCPSPADKPWTGVALFSAALVALLLLTLGGIWLWQRRVREAQNTAQRVVLNSAIPLVLQLATRAIDFAFALLLYGLLCKTAIGTYELLGLLVVMYLGTFADFGLTLVTTRDVARDPAAAPRYFRAMLRLRMLLGLASIPLAFVLPALYNLLYQLGLTNQTLQPQAGWVLALLVLTLLPTGYSAAVTALFNAGERLQTPAVLALVTNIISTLLRIGALALGLGIMGLAGGALLATLLSTLLYALALRRSFGAIPLRGPAMPYRSLLHEGWPLMLNSLLLFVFFRFDAFIIAPFHGEAALAEYNTAYKYINLTQIIPPIVVNALFPLLSRRAVDNQQGFQQAYHYTLRLLLLLALPVATTMCLLATPLIRLLTGNEADLYLPGGALALALLIWYLPMAYVNGLTQYALIALGRQRTITLAFGLTALFNLAANLALVPRWGILAAAVVTVASEIVLFLPLRHVLSRTVGRPPLLALAWRPAIACLMLAGGLIALRDQSPLLAVLLAPALYLAGLLALRTFTSEDRRMLRRVLGRQGKQPL